MNSPQTAPAFAPEPVYRGYFADPFVFQHEGVYYAVGTGALHGESGRAIPVLRSEDLRRWEYLGGALDVADPAALDYWAPEVTYRDGRFAMTYSRGRGDAGHHLRIAFADRPEGPYVDAHAPLLDPSHTPFAIDASPFQDVDGQWYLFYARDFLDTERPGTALAVTKWPSIETLGPEFEVVGRAHYDWQLFEARRTMYGGVHNWHTLEGPAVVFHEGLYYCFYSGGNWQNGTYGVDYLVADAVMGPYRDINPTGLPRVLRTIPDYLVGPGHNSLFRDAEGDLHIAFHAWREGERRFFISRILWTHKGPQCEAMPYDAPSV
jgi:beta-xylosidase